MFKETEHNSLCLEYGLHIVTSFQRMTCKKEDESNCREEKCDKHYLSEMIKVNSNRDKSSQSTDL